MDARRLHDGLSRWRDALGRRRNSALKADLLFASSTKGAAFAKWKAQSAEQAHNAVVADKAYAFFVLKDAFKMWRRALMRKRRGMLIAQRQQSTLKTAFDSTFMKPSLDMGMS
jgi:protein SFI1